MDTIADYSEWKSRRQQQTLGAANIVLQATEDKPDDVAGDLNLATEFGKVTGNPAPPLPMVKEYRSVFQKKIEEQRNSSILSGSPKLADWLRNPENAALASDDLERLAWMERFGVEPFKPDEVSFGQGLLNTGKRAGERLSLGGNQFMLEQTAGRARDRQMSFGELVEDERKTNFTDTDGNSLQSWDGSEYLTAFGRWVDAQYADVIGADDETASRGFASALAETQNRIKAIPKSDNATVFEEMAMVEGATLGQALANFGQAFIDNPAGALAWSIETAGESAPQLGASLATTLLTRNPMAGAAVAGAGSFLTERYVSPAEFFEEKKLDLSKPEDVERLLSDPALMEEAAQRGMIRGLIIGAFDMASMGVAGQSLAGNPFVEGLAQAASQAILGSAGEFSARKAAGQEMDWNEVLAEGLAELSTTPIDMGIAGRRLQVQRRDARDAEDRKAVFEQLSQGAQSSTLRTRMPDRFREFVAQATESGPVENVFIPAGEFVEYFQGIGVDPYTLINDLDGVTADDLDAALAGGGDLRIPTATYAAKMAGSEHDAFLIENMRFDPDAMTASEAAAFNERSADIQQEALEEAERIRLDDERYRTFEQEVYDTMVSRLRTAGRSTDVATNEAQLYVANVRTAAADEGMTIDEYLEAYPLPEVRGALPEGVQFKDVDALTRTIAEARNRRAVGLTPRGVSLLEFIDDYGGINDVGGDIRSMVKDGAVKRGRGKKTLRVTRDEESTPDMIGGVDAQGRAHGLDDVARAAIEAGYLRDHPVAQEYIAAMERGDQVPNISQALLDAIGEELRGRVQYTADAAPDQNAVDSEAALDDLDEYLNRLGVSLDDDDAAIRAAIEADQATDDDARMYAQDGGLNTESAAFKAWFGDSKVVDESGAPLVVYHGTRAGDFEAFDPGRTGEGSDFGWYGEGIYFTPDAEMASNYATINERESTSRRQQGSVYPAYISIENPYRTDQSGLTAEEVEEIKAEGYDGIFVVEYMRDAIPREIIAFEPTQIKSVNNRGTWDASDPRLLFQRMGNGARGSITALPNGRTIIDIFENANLSTVLHETGHYWLLNLQAREANGSEVASERLSVVKAWWRENAAEVAKDAMRSVPGVNVSPDDVIAAIDNGTSGDLARDAAIDIGMQEQFARAAEAYLMEGKAPTAELRTAFDKFRAWLVSVYRRLTSLNVTLSDDVRRVFDRILATDEEIAKAQNRSGGNAAVFSTAEAMGLTDEEYARFLKLREQAEADAKARLLAETMAPIKREQEQWYKEERAKVREEVERDVNSWRQFRAIEWMGNRRWFGDNQPENMPDMRMSKDILVRRYGEGILKTLPRGKFTVYTVEGGIDPDDAATWFGFASGDEMLRSMEAAPRRVEAIDAETDKLMRERHGDPLNDGSVEAHALDAVHSDKRMQWIAAELEAVRKILGEGAGLTYKEANEGARQSIARMRVRDAVASNRFLAAERKAGEEAYRLAGTLANEGYWQNRTKFMASDAAGRPVRNSKQRDQVAALYAAKRRQLINHALYMESRKVADEVEKAERFVAKLNRRSTREKIAGAGRREILTGEAPEVDYLAAIDEILDRYDFRRMSGRDEERRGSLNTFIEAMKAAGRENELNIPERVLMNAERRPYKTLPVEELRGVVDSLKNLEHVARRWNELVVNKKKREFAEATSTIIETIGKNVKGKDHDWVKQAGIKTNAQQGFSGYIASIRTATTILRKLDGREDLGPVYELMKSDLDAAAYRELEMSREAREKLQALYDVYSEDEQREMGVAIVRPQLRNRSFSKWNLIAMALNMGNEGNLARLTNDKARFFLNPAEIDAVKGMLNERDARFVQGVWDLIDSYRPMIAGRDRRVKGVAPEWVEPTPVTIGGQSLRGGYYPIKYDGQHGGGRPSAAEGDNDILASIMGGGYASAHTKDGHLKARGTHVRQSLTLDTSVINRHLTEVVHDLTHSEPVVNTWRMLTDSGVERAFLDAGLQDPYQQLKLWVQDAATGQVGSGATLARGITYLRGGFAYSKLAFSLRTILMQPMGVMQSAVAVGKKRMAAHMLRTMQNPLTVSAEVEAKSNMMKIRRDTFNKDLMDAAAQSNIASPAGNKARKFMDDVIIPLGMAGMVYTQYYTVDVPTWAAAYEKGMDQFAGDSTKAAQYADMTVQRSQGSGIWTDRSAIERGTLSGSIRQNPFVTLLTTLGSYFFAKMNMTIERTDALRAQPVTLQSSMSYALDMALLFVGEAFVIGLISEIFSGDDDDDEGSFLGDVAIESAKTLVAGLPVIRDAAGALQGFDTGTYGAILKTFTNPVYQASQGEIDKALVKSSINLIGMLARVPSAQVNRGVDAIWRQAEGEDVSPIEYLMGKQR